MKPFYSEIFFFYCRLFNLVQLFAFFYNSISGYVIGEVASQKPCEFDWILRRKRAAYAYICLHEQRQLGVSFVQ